MKATAVAYILAMITFFKKQYPKNPINLSNGAPLFFEDMNDGYGYLSTDKDNIISELRACIRDGRGGITESSQTEYDGAVKKKPSLRPLNSQFLRELQTSGLPATAPVVVPVESVAEVAASPVPITPAPIPEPVSPRVGKRSV